MVGLDRGIGLFDRQVHLTGQEKERLFCQAAVLSKTGSAC